MRFNQPQKTIDLRKKNNYNLLHIAQHIFFIRNKHMISSVKRAIDLLHCFSIKRPELSVSELSMELGVHKSTVSRLLATLAAENLVNRNPDNGKYRLGMGLIELSGSVVLHQDLRQIAKPYLRQLSELTQETVNLAVLENDATINIEQAVSYDRRVLGIGWVGRRAPLHASSTGKIFLAFSTNEVLTSLIQNPLPEFTPRTITDSQNLLKNMDKIRLQGYATGLEELEIGLNAVAAPIYNHNKDVIAAISVTGPPSRLSKQRINKEVSKQVCDYAKRISADLGYIE